jgi:hypothetical protein
MAEITYHEDSVLKPFSSDNEGRGVQLLNQVDQDRRESGWKESEKFEPRFSDLSAG